MSAMATVICPTMPMMQLVSGGFKQVSKCADVDSAYLDPIRAQEKALGIAQD